MNWPQIVRLGAAWYRGSVKLGFAPKQISIEPTNICNYRCSFCPQSDPAHHELPSGFMKLEHLDIILDKVLKAGAAWNGTISFTHDGDPLLHPEFPTFIRKANERGLKPRFSSNGSKLTPQKADQMEAAGYFRPSIDFSGSKEIFENYRGKPGHWDMTRGHLSYLIEMSNRNPKVSLEITEMGTYKRPEEAKELLAKLRSVLPKPTSNRVQFGIRVFHNAAGSAPPSELLQLHLPNGGSSNGASSNGTSHAPTKPRYRQCPYPWAAMTIAWNGEVHACCRDLEGRTRLGNMLTCESLWDIWNGNAYQEFRHHIAARQPEMLDACAGCDLPWAGNPKQWSLRNIYRVLRYR